MDRREYFTPRQHPKYTPAYRCFARPSYFSYCLKGALMGPTAIAASPTDSVAIRAWPGCAAKTLQVLAWRFIETSASQVGSPFATFSKGLASNAYPVVSASHHRLWL